MYTAHEYIMFDNKCDHRVKNVFYSLSILYFILKKCIHIKCVFISDEKKNVNTFRSASHFRGSVYKYI